MQVTEDFLQEEYYDHLNEIITSTQFPWMFQKRVANIEEDPEEDLNHYYFVHSLFFQNKIESPLYDDFLYLFQSLNVQFLHRARVLMFVNQGEQYIHDRHVDHTTNCKTALIYMNTNDGFTDFETGERVESVKNRLLLFDGSIPHSSSTPTNTKERLLLSVTYI
tara:strand:- start:21189 stop:21680 length:492 start_codon:yes stop_codon:yes gene_type:complete